MRFRQIAKAAGGLALTLLGFGQMSDGNSSFSKFCFVLAFLFGLWFAYTWWRNPDWFKDPSAEEIADAIQAKDSKERNALIGWVAERQAQAITIKPRGPFEISDAQRNDVESRIHDDASNRCEAVVTQSLRTIPITPPRGGFFLSRTARDLLLPCLACSLPR